MLQNFLCRNRIHFVMGFFSFALFVFMISRAARMDFTIDEADTALAWVIRDTVWRGHPIQWASSSNNHLLNSLLMNISNNFFGNSPFTLRIPALLGSMIYVFISQHFAVQFSRNILLSVLIFILLTLNPFVMDYMIVARGYSWALCCELGAILVIVNRVSGRGEPPVWIASVCAGIGLAANYSFLFGFAALFMAYLIWVFAKRGFKDCARQSWSLAWPAGAILLVLCFDNISGLKSTDIAWGAKSISDMISGISQQVFQGPNLYIVPPHLLELSEALNIAAPFLLAVLAVLLLTSVVFRGEPPHRDISAICVGAITITLAAHLLMFSIDILKVLPLGRTALVFIPLATIAFISGVSSLKGSLRHTFEAALSVFAVVFVSSLHFWYVKEWAYVADIKNMIQAATAYAQPRKIENIGTTWDFVASGNYYIKYLGLPLQELKGDSILLSGNEIYFIAPRLSDFIKSENLEVIYRGANSGAVVAVRH